MKIRPAGSFMDFAEAMERVKDVSSMDELMEYLRREYQFWNPTLDNVTIEKYGDGDHRNGWNTHLICVDGKAALFSDGGSFDG